MVRKIQPLGNRVVLKAIEGQEVSKGGIILPDTAKEKPQEGEVIAVGPGRMTDDGKRIPIDLKAGDKVLFSKYGGTEIKDAGIEYIVIEDNQILAKVG